MEHSEKWVLLWKIMDRLRRRQRVWLVWTETGWEVL